MPDQPIYFIRHKFTGRDEVASHLQDKKYIGFHFSDDFHEKKENYKAIHEGYERGFSRAYDAFETMGKFGAIIVFEYNDPNIFFIATVSDNQKIRPFPFVTAEKDELMYKTLEYRDVRQFNYAVHPVLLALRPPYSTVCQPGEHFQKSLGISTPAIL